MIPHFRGRWITAWISSTGVSLPVHWVVNLRWSLIPRPSTQDDPIVRSGRRRCWTCNGSMTTWLKDAGSVG